jgi:hypothetical protein
MRSLAPRLIADELLRATPENAQGSPNSSRILQIPNSARALLSEPYGLACLVRLWCLDFHVDVGVDFRAGHCAQRHKQIRSLTHTTMIPQIPIEPLMQSATSPH